MSVTTAATVLVGDRMGGRHSHGHDEHYYFGMAARNNTSTYACAIIGADGDADLRAHRGPNTFLGR